MKLHVIFIRKQKDYKIYLSLFFILTKDKNNVTLLIIERSFCVLCTDSIAIWLYILVCVTFTIGLF